MKHPPFLNHLALLIPMGEMHSLATYITHLTEEIKVDKKTKVVCEQGTC